MQKCPKKHASPQLPTKSSSLINQPAQTRDELFIKANSITSGSTTPGILPLIRLVTGLLHDGTRAAFFRVVSLPPYMNAEARTLRHNYLRLDWFLHVQSNCISNQFEWKPQMLSTLEKNQGTQVPLYRFRCPNVRLQVAFGFDFEIVRYEKRPSKE